MKKILVVFDGLKYSDSAVTYAIDIAKDSNALLVGVFLHDMSYLSISYTYRWSSPYTNAWDSTYKPDPADEEKIKANTSIFASKCEQAGVKFKMHIDRGVPIEELLQESAFADLLIMDARLAFSNVAEDEMAAQFIEMLSEVQCPVLIVPSVFEKINNAILAYDGSASSTYAIKMYSYLFPEWKNYPTRMVSVNAEHPEMEQKHHILDLLNERFTDFHTDVLKGSAKQTLLTYLKTFTNNTVVVMGAYGRPALSMLFRKSMANAVIREVMVPVFIAHT